VESLFRDEVLIFLATLGACGLLVLGVLELVWPSRPAGSARHAEGMESLAERAEVVVARH
jgi:hypothetical protein